MPDLAKLRGVGSEIGKEEVFVDCPDLIKMVDLLACPPSQVPLHRQSEILESLGIHRDQSSNMSSITFVHGHGGCDGDLFLAYALAKVAYS